MQCKNIFRFKKFFVCQDNSAMKIGTDGVLLGAWTVFQTPEYILDIGTGSGLIALMMAQKFSDASIDAVEIEKEASKEAESNFKISPWNKRLKIYPVALQEFKPPVKYDIIISNPPFFDESIEAKGSARQIARQNHRLNIEDIFKFSDRFLASKGIVNLVYPYSKAKKLINIAGYYAFYPAKITYVKGNVNSVIKRILISFSREKILPIENQLIIEKSRHHYTDDYIRLTRDFYLKM